jgi:uncharacterized protein (DUF111 family)
MLECNIDDTTPEIIGVLMEDVLAAGALDVTCTPVTMKKQRPGLVFSVLIEPAMREKMLDLIFRGCTTFGIREYPVFRTKLTRRIRIGRHAVRSGQNEDRNLARVPTSRVHQKLPTASASHANTTCRCVWCTMRRADVLNRKPS